MTVMAAPTVLDGLVAAARAAGARFEDACYNVDRPHRRLTVWHGCDRIEIWHVDATITVTVAYGRHLPAYVPTQETGAVLDLLAVTLTGHGGVGGV